MKKIILLMLIISLGLISCEGSNKNETGDTYMISFDLNGGVGGQTASVSAAFGSPMPVITGIPTLEEPALTPYDPYYFDGYFDAKTGGTKYYNSDLSSAKKWDKKNDTTLYARYISVVDKYNITNFGDYDYAAPFAATAPVIDGKGDDEIWAKARWMPIDQVWLGGGNASQSNLTPPPEGTYSGRFKIVWTEDRLYYLVEILDTYLSLTRLNTPLSNFHLDDCLELFINEDALGGDHERNHSAFAYHVSYNNPNVADTGTNGQGILFNEHLNYVIGNLDLPGTKSIDGTDLYTWEVEMKIFDKTYNQANFSANTPVTLTEGKKMGFAVAYCNAGPSNTREYFMGSMYIPGANKNVAWQNASVFAKLYLVK